MSKERHGLSLAMRIFLGTALILVLALGAAVAAVSILGERVAGRAARERIAASSSLATGAEQQRLHRLSLAARVLATNADFQTALAEAIPNHDRLAILDQLDARRGDLGYDLAVVTDQNGTVAARTDQRDAEGGSLADRALLRKARSGAEAAGAWVEGGKLYDAVAAPVVGGGVLAYLVLGSQIGDVNALEVKRATGSEVLLVAGDRVVATSLSRQDTERALAALRRGGDLLARAGRGESAAQGEIELGGSRWLALLAPLPDAEGRSVGAVVSLASLDRGLAGFRSLLVMLLVLAAVALAAALAMSLLLARGFSQPLRALAAAVASARGGASDVALPRGGSGEAAALANAVGGMITEIGERRALADYVSKASRRLTDGSGAPAGAPAPGGRAEGRKTTVAAIELRRYLSPRNLADPGESLARLGRDVRKIADIASARNGRIESLAGHRVLLAFTGDARSEHALAAAAEIQAAVAVRENAFDDAEPPASALVAGEALCGSLAWGGGVERVLIAPAVTQAEGLLREAESGEILLSTAVQGEAAGALARAGLALEPQRGLLQAQSFFRVGAPEVARLAGAAPAAAGTVAAAPAVVGPGALVGARFEIVSTIGAGALGVVYKARDRELGDLVALKLLQREAAADRALVERLRGETESARRVIHPNVVRILDAGALDGTPFVAMELVRGNSLRALLDVGGRLPYAAGLQLARELLAGLSAAHALEVAHRDLKPENVLLGPLGEVRIVDFGQARPARRVDGGPEQPAWLAPAPQYLAPEQIEGRAGDARSDVYACGVLLFETFTGKLPFSGQTPAEIVRQHLEQPPAAPSLHWTAIPKPLEALILRCLEKRPEARPADARALLREVERLGG